MAPHIHTDHPGARRALTEVQHSSGLGAQVGDWARAWRAAAELNQAEAPVWTAVVSKATIEAAVEAAPTDAGQTLAAMTRPKLQSLGTPGNAGHRIAVAGADGGNQLVVVVGDGPMASAELGGRSLSGPERRLAFARAAQAILADVRALAETERTTQRIAHARKDFILSGLNQDLGKDAVTRALAQSDYAPGTEAEIRQAVADPKAYLGRELDASRGRLEGAVERYEGALAALREAAQP